MKTAWTSLSRLLLIEAAIIGIVPLKMKLTIREWIG